MSLKVSQNSQKSTCARFFFQKTLQVEASNFIKKETLVQVFSREFCKISKNTFFTEHLWTTVSGYSRTLFSWLLVYHFITLLETSMFIQCCIDFHLWTVAKYNSDWVCFKHILLCYHIGKYWYFLKPHMPNKSFQQNPDQSSTVT